VYWLEQTKTVENLKEAIYRRSGMPIHCQRLRLGGERLEDQRVLFDYHIRDDCVITLTRIGGCRDFPRSNTEWPTVMTPLELDHYGYLLGKISEQFRQEKQPHTEVSNSGRLTNNRSLNTSFNDGKTICCRLVMKFVLKSGYNKLGHSIITLTNHHLLGTQNQCVRVEILL
jgi:hypothetical protein